MKRLAILLVLFLFACSNTYQPAVPVEDILNGPSHVVEKPAPTPEPEPVPEVVEAEPVEAVPEVEPEVVEVVIEPEDKGEIVNIDVILKGEHARVNVMFEHDEEEFTIDHNNKEVILGMLSGKYDLSTRRTEAVTTFLQEAGTVVQEEEEPEEEPVEETQEILYTKVVEILGYKYNPEVIYIKPHTRIVWNHKDLATHSVTAASGLFNSHEMMRGDSFSYDFHEYGTYEYFSSPYPSMRGKVVVQD